jgi:hypothetical protein
MIAITLSMAVVLFLFLTTSAFKDRFDQAGLAAVLTLP